MKEVSIMAKKSAVTCERKTNFYTPCYIIDGVKGLDKKTGKCLGCGKTAEEIENSSIEKVKEQMDSTIELNQEQSIEMKKIHKELYRFFKALEKSMFNGLIEGKTGWDTELSTVLRDRLTDNFNKLLEGKNVEKDSIDLAAYCMMIWRRV